MLFIINTWFNKLTKSTNQWFWFVSLYFVSILTVGAVSFSLRWLVHLLIAK